MPFPITPIPSYNPVMAPTLPSLTRRPRTSCKVASPKRKALSRVTAGFKAHSDGDGYPGFSCILRIEQTFGSRYVKKRSSKPQLRLSSKARRLLPRAKTVFSRSAGCHCQTSAGESESDGELADEDTEDDASRSEHRISEEPEDGKAEPSPARPDRLTDHTEKSSSKCNPSTSSNVQESIEVIEVPATPEVADASVEADASVPSVVLSVDPPTTAQEAERVLEIATQVPPDSQDVPDISPLTPSSSSTHSELNGLFDSLNIREGPPTTGTKCSPPKPEPQLGSKRPADVEWEDGPPTKKQRVETDIDNDADPSSHESRPAIVPILP